MKQAIEAYRSITASSEFRESERLRLKARHDEVQALRKARLEGVKIEREKWRSAIADKEAVIADKDAVIAKLRAQLDKAIK